MDTGGIIDRIKDLERLVAELTKKQGGGALVDGSVTNAKLANMATKTYKGRTASGTGVPADVPVATLKSDLALNNVDNTADTAKPVSTAQQTALNLKANSANPSFTGELNSVDTGGFYPKYRGMLSDFNTALSRGEYMFAGTNIPNAYGTGTIYGLVRVIVSTGDTHNGASNWIWQEAWSTNGGYYTRMKINNCGWTGWSQRW